MATARLRQNGRSSLLDFLLRHRLIGVALVALCHALWDGSTSPTAGDGVLFARAGAKLFSGAWSRALADPAIQVGPLHLVLSGVVRAIASGLHVADKFVLASAVEVGSVVGLALVARALWGRSARAAVAEVALCGLWIVWLGGVAMSLGQAAESLIPILWVAAALAARRGRPVAAGLAIGASGALKAWGLLGVPILVLDEDNVRAAVAASVAVATTAVSYLPFLLWGSVASFSYKWTVSAAAPAHYVLATGSTFSWVDRLVQGALVLALGVAVARWGRRCPAAVWGLPLVLVVVRVLVDPVYYWYYWVPAQTLALIGIVGYVVIGRSWRGYAAAGLLYAPLFLSTDHPPWVGALVLTAAFVSLKISRPSHRSRGVRGNKVVAAVRAS